MAITDWLGWAATGVFVASYACRRPDTLRRVQMAGATMWIALWRADAGGAGRRRERPRARRRDVGVEGGWSRSLEPARRPEPEARSPESLPVLNS